MNFEAVKQQYDADLAKAEACYNAVCENAKTLEEEAKKELQAAQEAHDVALAALMDRPDVKASLAHLELMKEKIRHLKERCDEVGAQDEKAEALTTEAKQRWYEAQSRWENAPIEDSCWGPVITRLRRATPRGMATPEWKEAEARYHDFYARRKAVGLDELTTQLNDLNGKHRKARDQAHGARAALEELLKPLESTLTAAKAAYSAKLREAASERATASSRRKTMLQDAEKRYRASLERLLQNVTADRDEKDARIAALEKERDEAKRLADAELDRQREYCKLLLAKQTKQEQEIEELKRENLRIREQAQADEIKRLLEEIAKAP